MFINLASCLSALHCINCPDSVAVFTVWQIKCLSGYIPLKCLSGYSTEMFIWLYSIEMFIWLFYWNVYLVIIHWNAYLVIPLKCVVMFHWNVYPVIALKCLFGDSFEMFMWWFHWNVCLVIPFVFKLGCLTLAELGRRGLLLPDRLKDGELHLQT